MSGVVKKGWLSKREEVSGSLTTWRKRWFMLSEEELSWYKSDRDPLTGAAPLGSVPVASIEEVKFAYLEKKYCFTIRTHDQIFGVHADDAEGRDAWLMTFSDLMLKAKSHAAEKKKNDAPAPAGQAPAAASAPATTPAPGSPTPTDAAASSTPTTASPIKAESKEEESATQAPKKEEKEPEKVEKVVAPEPQASEKKDKETSRKKTDESLRLPPGSPSLSRRDDREEERPKVEHYVFFEIRGRCPNCMQGMVVNGPVRSLRCIFCESRIELRSDKLWDTILARITHSDYGTLAKNGMINSTIGGGYLAGRSYVFNDNIMKEVTNPVDSVVSYLTIGHGFEKPKCPSCKTPYDDLGTIANGEDRVFSCQTCGHNSLTFPLPQWMVEDNVDRGRWQIFCATDRYDFEDEALQDALEAKLSDKKAQELVMACPKCQKAIDLSSTKGYERIVACDHCGVNVVRPRVDPVRKARRWYIRYYY